MSGTTGIACRVHSREVMAYRELLATVVEALAFDEDADNWAWRVPALRGALGSMVDVEAPTDADIRTVATIVEQLAAGGRTDD